MRTTTLLLGCTIAPASLHAGIIDTVEVGEGLSTSTVQVDFSNGNGYVFNVHWMGEGVTGWDLLLAIADELDAVSLDYSTSEWGVFLEGITIGEDSDWGVGAGWPEVEDYWHYWTSDSQGDEWVFAMIGADVREVSDGSWDGWVFLSPDAPQQVPAPGGLLLLLAVAGIPRRRRCSGG